LNRKVLFAGAIVILPILVVLAANLGKDPRQIRSPLVGRVAPPFTLRVAGTNDTVSLASLKGTPVVLNFWATWCVPCIEEHGVVTAAARMPQNGNVKFYGVVFNDVEKKALDFMKENGSGFPSLIDPGAQTAISYGVYGVPETFFIDRNGKIADKYEGPLSPDILQQHLQEVTR
jgi:cytochrome c biogenesis protein CcmG/thiol:disulfide interchange protein DsbE